MKSSPAQSFSAPSPAGLMTTFYCLRFETPPTWKAMFPCLYPQGIGWPGYTPQAQGSLFVASYDSKGYGGGIRFHTEVTLNCQIQIYFTTSGLSPISSSWRQAPWDPRPDFFFRVNSCGNSPYVTSSLTRRWVCLLSICLAFRQVYISHI
jgi:hypothetical protein